MSFLDLQSIVILFIFSASFMTMDSIDVRKLEINRSSQTQENLETYKSNEKAARNWPKTPFPIDDELNNKIMLYDGNLDTLIADCIVNPTNENLSHLEYVSDLTGPELEIHIKRKMKYCITGNVRVTSGFDSNFNSIIHAVPPKYQPKYKTAAETALFRTYFRILETMIEKRLRTVVMPILATTKCNLPLEENFNLQLRVLRRMLEQKRQDFDKIVVHVTNIDEFTRPFYSYFPQTSVDEEIACYFLNTSIGGPNGEPVIPEREIRIKSKPGMLDPMNQSIDLQSGLDLSTVVGKTEFSKMREDLDLKRMTLNDNKTPDQVGNRILRGCTLL